MFLFYEYSNANINMILKYVLKSPNISFKVCIDKCIQNDLLMIVAFYPYPLFKSSEQYLRYLFQLKLFK